MASDVLTSRTIRGVSYSQGDSFICASAVKGNAGSEGDGNSAAALTVGDKYYFLGYAVATDSGTTIKYPCRVGSSSSVSSAIGYYPESVFPYATYKITFNANGGSLGDVPSRKTKTYGTALTLPSAKPTRSGWTFVGWGTSADDTTANYSAGGSYTANAADTLYAIWKKTITLTYNDNGGSGAPSIQSATVYNATTSYKFTLSSTKPKRTGYTFAGWNTKSDGSGTTYSAGGSCTISSSTTLYAKWTINSYTLTIDPNGGYRVSNGSTEIATDDWNYASEISIGERRRDGYTLTGYKITNTSSGSTTNIGDATIAFDDSTKKATFTQGSVEVTLTAQWKANSYTLTLNGNKGTPDNQTLTLTYDLGNYWVIGSSTPTRLGYEFLGWYTSIDGGVQVYDANGICTNEGTYWENNVYVYPNDLTLYAQWKSSGIVYIDNGTSHEKYLVYIDNGTSWDMYIAYIDNGTSWDMIS